VSVKTQAARQGIADEAQSLLDELYLQLKSNSAKLIEIDRALRSEG